MKTNNDAVQAVDRAMRILSALANPNGRGQRLKDLASHTKMHPSTVHRLLTTMQQREFVHYEQADSTWHVGRNAYLAAAGFLGGINYVTVAKPFIKRLRDTVLETCSLGVIEGREILIVSQFQGREIERILSRVGRCLPIARSAMGHAMLAAWWDRDGKPDVIIDAISGVDDVDRPALERSIEAVKRTGFAVSEARALDGVRTIASPVCGVGGKPLCAISIAGTVDRLSLDRIDEAGRKMAEVAADISAAIVVKELSGRRTAVRGTV